MYRRYRSRYVSAVLLLIGINLLLFIATMIHRDLILLLGLYSAGLIERPWTMVTNLFIHGGIGHILANMLTLYFFGTFLARLIGEKKFLIIYFLGGIAGNIFYILLGDPFTIAIGASGAVFALGGVLTVMTPKLRVFVFPIPVPIPLWTAVIGGFFILSFFPHVAWQAHLGGLVAGLIVGLILRKRRLSSF